MLEGGVTQLVVEAVVYMLNHTLKICFIVPFVTDSYSIIEI